MPFRMIRAEYVVLRTLPLIASLNPIVLIVCDRRNLLRFWLRAEVRVLRLNLLHLLRIGLGLLPARHISLCVLLAGSRCWSSTHRTRGRCRSRCRSSGCFRSTSLHPFPRLLRAGRGTGGRLTGNIRSRLGAGPRFLARFALSALSCAALGRHTGGRLTGNICSRLGAGRRFLARLALSALSCAALRRRTAGRLTGNICSRLGAGRRFLARSIFSALSCTGLICRAGLCFGRVRLLNALLFLLCW